MPTDDQAIHFHTLTDIVKQFPERGSQDAIRLFTGFRILRYSYENMYDRSLRCAALFDEKGITKGDCVLLWAPNSPEWAAIYFACVLSGVVLVPLDARNTADFVKRVAGETEAKLLIRTQFTLDPELSIPTLFIETLFNQLEKLDPPSNLPEITPDDLVEIVYTSGTTGNPKGVMLTHKNLASNVSDVFQIVRTDPTYHLMSVLPLSHALEQTGGFWTPLAGGGTILYLSVLKPSALFDVFRRENITVMVLVPRLLTLIKKRVEETIAEMHLTPYLKFGLNVISKCPRWMRTLYFYPIHKRFSTAFHLFVCGGSALDPQVESFWKKIGFELLQGYGLTETSPVLTVTRRGDECLGSVGLSLEHVDIRLTDEQEIQAKGPNIFQGYYKRPELNQDNFEDGWFKTGDIGEFDEDGYLYIRSRKKDVIVTSDGINVYPEDIEHVLENQETVKEACVLGTGDQQEIVHAVLLLDPPDADARRCIEQANRQLPPEQHIKDFTIWPMPEFPKTTTLKIKKNDVRKVIESSETETAFHDSQSRSPIQRILSEVTSLEPDEIQANARLGQDLGLTSIDRVELISRLESEFRIDIDENMITSETTVDELEALVSKRKTSDSELHFRRWTLSRSCRMVRVFFEWLLIRPLLSLFCKVKCLGWENVQTIQGPIFIIANHTSHVDTPLIQTLLSPTLGRRICPAAWKEYFDTDETTPLIKKIGKWFAWQISTIGFNIFPFPQTTGFRKSMVYAGELIDKGWSVLLYPEGARSQSGELSEFREGVGILARNLHVPILPIAIIGGEKILPRGKGIPKRSEVKIAFGQPLTFNQSYSYTEIALRLKSEIENLRDRLLTED